MTKLKIRYCVLAKSIPEYSKRDDSLYTCSLGFSPELGLIRVYPLPVKSMNKWDIYEIYVEKNKLDTRKESWKLCSYARKENWTSLDKDAKFIRKANIELVLKTLANYTSPSINFLNKSKLSIGLVDALEYRVYWDVNDKYINSTQFGLFEDVELADFTKYTKHTKEKVSRIYFRDRGGEHDLQFNEWGIYEYQRKFGAKNEVFQLYQNKPYILLGNMHNYRNTWIGLSVFKKEYHNQLQITI